MPHITFTVDGISHFAPIGNGLVTLQPALPSQGRLYVIWSNHHHRHAYVGTSSDVQDRFNQRLAALNETGVAPETLEDTIFVYTIRITINNINHQPNNLGVAGNIDVEHLLLRIYHRHYHFGLRNTLKWNTPFQNADNNGLFVRHIDPHHLVADFDPLVVADAEEGFRRLLNGIGQY